MYALITNRYAILSKKKKSFWVFFFLFFCHAYVSIIILLQHNFFRSIGRMYKNNYIMYVKWSKAKNLEEEIPYSYVRSQVEVLK
jgi:hypothetical protein